MCGHKTHRFVKRDALEVSSRHRYPLLTRATRSSLVGHGFEQGAANTLAAFVRIEIQHKNLPGALPGRSATTRPEHPTIATFGDQPAIPVICQAVPINRPANLVADPLEAVILSITRSMRSGVGMLACVSREPSEQTFEMPRTSRSSALRTIRFGSRLAGSV